MNLIVLDFEWNQAMRSDSPVFNRLPIHLRGEIIEIGAVKLNSDFTPGEEFTVDVRPVYFRQMHYKVKKITGFDKERLSAGDRFPVAFDKFRSWCGEDPVFITWGNDDQGIFEQNIIIHDLDWEWISGWINLQLIYNVQTGLDKTQKSLADAMSHFSIEQTRVAHDALGDAYNTALVCSHLDMPDGISRYDEAPAILASRMVKATSPVPETFNGPEPLFHDSFEGYETKAAVFADERIAHLSCPICSKMMSGLKWVNQSDGRYMNLYSCAEHGQFLARVRFKKLPENDISANLLVYDADEDMTASYKAKAAQARRRGRGRRSSRNK